MRIHPRDNATFVCVGADRYSRGAQASAYNLGIPNLGKSVIGRKTFSRVWEADTGRALPTEDCLRKLLSHKKTSLRVTVRLRLFVPPCMRFNGARHGRPFAFPTALACILCAAAPSCNRFVLVRCSLTSHDRWCSQNLRWIGQLRASPWTALGWTTDSPGFAFLYQAMPPVRYRAPGVLGSTWKF